MKGFTNSEVNKLTEALELYIPLYNAKFFNEAELGSITFSEEFEHNMQLLINSQKKSKVKLLSARKKRVICLIAAILLLLATAGFGVTAVRKRQHHFIVNKYDKYSDIIVATEKPQGTTSEPDIYLQYILIPTYIPEGYKLTKEEDLDDVYMFEYQKSKSAVITLDEFTIAGTGNIMVDTEDAYVEDITVNGMEGIYVDKCYAGKYYHKTIVWSDGRYQYLLGGTMTRDEIFKMVKSLKKVEHPKTKATTTSPQKDD